MTAKADIVHELHVASNTIHDVAPAVRQRLLMAGIDEAISLRRLAQLAGLDSPEVPGFMDDMPKLADMAGDGNAVEVLIAAGMSMLASEIARLRDIVDGALTGRLVERPDRNNALDEAKEKDRLPREATVLQWTSSDT